MCNMEVISPCMENECDERWRIHNPMNKPLETAPGTGNPVETTETPKEGVKETPDALKTEEKPPVRDEKGLFQPGTAPGPGRPKGSLAFKTAIEKWADREAALEKDGTKVTKMELIAKKLVELAEAGNIKAIEMLADRIDGKPRQTIDATIDSRTPIDPDKQALVNEAVKEMFKKP